MSTNRAAATEPLLLSRRYRAAATKPPLGPEQACAVAVQLPGSRVPGYRKQVADWKRKYRLGSPWVARAICAIMAFRPSGFGAPGPWFSWPLVLLAPGSPGMAPTHARLLDTVYNRLISGRYVLLAGAVVLTIAAWFPASRLTFDQSIESLYSPNDPRLAAYLDSRGLFGGDEFVVVAWSESELFQPDGDGLTPRSTQRIRRFAQQLSEVSGVRAASTQSLADALRFPYRRDRIRQMAEGTLLGLNGTTTAVVLRLMPAEEAPVPRGRTITELRELAATHNPPAYVVGEPVQIFDMFQYVEQDGRSLFRVSLALLALVMSVLFRRVRWVLLAILVVLAAIVWTQAVLVISRMQLSLVSSMLNSLVTVIGIATVMHVTVHFRELRRSYGREDAMRQTLVDLGPAVLWTCLTTAAGFAALLVSELSPVRSFAIMMALGTLLVLLVMALTVPGVILLGRRGGDPCHAPLEASVARGLGRLAGRLEHRPLRVMLVAAALVAFAAAGFPRLTVETDFSRNFRRTSPIVQSLRYVES
ncbi:MAG: MMPL family transporter, partial [Patescibacteria group bacterium]|nr:MMPL family transporter [Patescibacteria group bacterium]